MTQRKKELALTDGSPSGATLSPAEEGETTKPSPNEESSVPSSAVIPGPVGEAVAASPVCPTAILSDTKCPPSVSFTGPSSGGGLVPAPRPPLRKTAMAAGVKRKLERTSDAEAGGSGGKKQRALVAPTGHESEAALAPGMEAATPADKDDAHLAPEYSFTVDPLMGNSFQLQLAPDASMFDLKDAIFTKTGVVHEMQLLGHSAGTVDFDKEEVFLDETALPSQCRLSLSVRAATGKPLASRREEVGVGETEGYFVAELLLPVDSSGEGDEDDSDEAGGESSSSSSGAATGGEDEDGERPSSKSSLRHSPKWTTATTAIPLADLASYLGGNPLLSSGDELHRDLASLRIEIVPAREEPERAVSPVETSSSPVSNSHGDKAPPPVIAVHQDGAPPHRCQQCGVRCRLAQQFRCKCGSMFCPQHRFVDQHGCRFDHKSFDRQRLQVSNPKVCASQVADL